MHLHICYMTTHLPVYHHHKHEIKMTNYEHPCHNKQKHTLTFHLHPVFLMVHCLHLLGLNAALISPVRVKRYTHYILRDLITLTTLSEQKKFNVPYYTAPSCFILENVHKGSSAPYSNIPYLFFSKW